MATIYFAGTYPPIMCGIADYTYYLVRESPYDRYGVISFVLNRNNFRQVGQAKTSMNAWYGIPSFSTYSSKDIHQGLRHFEANNPETVIWFQHEPGIWMNSGNFISMLCELDIPKIVTLHTLNFESHDTPSGLRSPQYDLLQELLPHIHAITVFNHQVKHAVTSAFPQYSEKVHVIEHGIHNYPQIDRLSRSEARNRMYHFLMQESDLNFETKQKLHDDRVFDDENTIVIGQTGFLCPHKQSEALYMVRNQLEGMISDKRIVALRIGGIRESAQYAYAQWLRQECHNRNAYLLDTWLPDEILPLAQRAFDINFYWPTECTQSGIMAHAIGAGAIIAGRKLEGVGEMLKDAGEMYDTNIHRLISKISHALRHPGILQTIEQSALKYARIFSWSNQIEKHYQLADQCIPSLSAHYPSDIFEPDPLVRLITGDPSINLSTHPGIVRTLLRNIYHPIRTKRSEQNRRS